MIGYFDNAYGRFPIARPRKSAEARELAELMKFAELMRSEPCELYAFHIRELANSIYFQQTSSDRYEVTPLGREMLSASNPHLRDADARKAGVGRNVRSSSAIEGVSAATFSKAAGKKT